MTISQSAKDAAEDCRKALEKNCNAMNLDADYFFWDNCLSILREHLQQAIDTETSSLRKTLVEAIARREELERQVQFMVDQGKMP